MSQASLQITAAKTRPTAVAAAAPRRSAIPNPVLLFWTRMINSAVADACKTSSGLPTDTAIISRWWIEDQRPVQKDKDDWETSFECACGWLNMDAALERVRLLAVIDEELRKAAAKYFSTWLTYRKAMVLSCAGVPTHVDGQYVVPLINEREYDDVAGVDHADPPNIIMPALRGVDAIAATQP